jgi:phosphoadenosine phosphosulfate reductase
MNEACYKDDRKNYLHPIIDWGDDDVWEYIHRNNLPYCSLYDEGFKRLGCILCPMSRNREREEKRWPRFVALYKKAIDRCVEKRIADGLTKDRKGNEFRHKWITGDDMWDWWLHAEDRTKEDPDQTVMFE